jgi:hypothetical protein
VYAEALKAVPHKHFTFAKLWILAANLEVSLSLAHSLSFSLPHSLSPSLWILAARLEAAAERAVERGAAVSPPALMRCDLCA